MPKALCRVLRRICLILSVSPLLFAAPGGSGPGGNGVVPSQNWFDSYSANGNCYIDSTFDHGIGNKVVPTPIGGQTVRQIAAKLGPGPGRVGNPVYNDVQCGNGPANNAGDEDYDQCPGRVDQGAAGCAVIGPQWNLTAAYGTPSSNQGVQRGAINPLSDASSCSVMDDSLAQAKSTFSRVCESFARKDCDPVVVDNRKVWMCASFQIGVGAPASSGSKPAVAPASEMLAGRCDALGDNLGAAKAAYARRCSAPRRDCDPTGNRAQYLCASYNITSKPVVAAVPKPAPAEPLPQPVQNPEPVSRPVAVPVKPEVPAEPVTAAPVSDRRCEVTAATLAQAKEDYAMQCSRPRKDCDPVGGGYMCASYAIGSGSPGGSAAPVTGGTPTVSAATPAGANPGAQTVRIQAESQFGAGWVNRGDYIEFTGANSYAAPTYGSLSYNVTIPADGDWELRWRAKAAKQTAGRTDLHNDAWARMNGAAITGFHDVRNFRKVFSSGTGGWQVAATAEIGSHNFTRFRQRFAAGNYKFEISGRSDGYALDYIEFVQINGQPANQGGGTSGSGGSLDPLGSISAYLDTFNQPYVDGDLLSLHWDSSMDPDDMQAMILTREILDDYSPKVDFIAVNGTKRNSNPGILSGSTEHMRSMFPSGYEAFRNGLSGGDQARLYQDTVNTFATAWALTLGSGNRVHVAAGGPANFTASVIDVLRSRGMADTTLKNIRVVQHSWGWNERNTDARALDTIRRYTQYIRIADGNLGNGEGNNHSVTPDYEIKSGADPECARFRGRAVSSRYSSQWKEALQRIRNKCDGSDAVEVLWILGIRTSTVPTLGRFADVYF